VASLAAAAALALAGCSSGPPTLTLRGTVTAGQQDCYLFDSRLSYVVVNADTVKVCLQTRSTQPSAPRLSRGSKATP
jgi:uncharacterized lipoprotein YajG